MQTLLRLAGKHGTFVVMAGVIIGFCFPVVSNAARPLLAVAIFVFTFGSVLKVDLESFRNEAVHAKGSLLIVAWATFGVPLVVFAILSLTRPGPDLTQGILFWSLVPTSPAAVAFAVILGLRTPLALLAGVLATAAAPFYLPWLAAALGGYHLTVSPAAMSLRLVLLIGGASVAAIVVKRFAGRTVRDNPDAMTGIAVSALMLAGIGSMRGVQAYFLAQPLAMLKYLVLAYAMTLGFQLLGTVLFWRCPRDSALTAGLISGTRTITLAWVVLGHDILPLANIFLAAGMIAKYTCPAMTRALIARLNKPAAEVALAT